MTHFMTTLLDRKDRMTMGATIEARVPFADTKLIEYLWNVPFSYKYRKILLLLKLVKIVLKLIILYF